LQNAYIVRDRLPYGVEQPVVGEQLVAMLERISQRVVRPASIR